MIKWAEQSTKEICLALRKVQMGLNDSFDIFERDENYLL